MRVLNAIDVVVYRNKRMTTRSPVRRSGQSELLHVCRLESASNLTNLELGETGETYRRSFCQLQLQGSPQHGSCFNIQAHKLLTCRVPARITYCINIQATKEPSLNASLLRSELRHSTNLESVQVGTAPKEAVAGCSRLAIKGNS